MMLYYIFCAIGIVSFLILGIYCLTQDTNNLIQSMELDNTITDYFQTVSSTLTNYELVLESKAFNCTSKSSLSDMYLSSYASAWMIFGISLGIAAGQGFFISCYGYCIDYFLENYDLDLFKVFLVLRLGIIRHF